MLKHKHSPTHHLLKFIRTRNNSKTTRSYGDGRLVEAEIENGIGDEFKHTWLLWPFDFSFFPLNNNSQKYLLLCLGPSPALRLLREEV